jgi:hypothetical protein
MSDSSRSPVLILGFHHSGTRLLAQLLAEMGVFQVVDDGPFEWRYVQKINERLCPHWGNPSALQDWLHSKAPKAALEASDVMSNLQQNGYQSGLWGVKDPRLCLTAPLWLRAFPDGSSVIIHRDPLSVLGTFPEDYAYFTPGKRSPLSNLPFWSQLYAIYYQSLRQISVSASRVIELRYEDIAANPIPSLSRLGRFLGISDAENAARGAIARHPFDKNRGNRLARVLESGAVTTSQLDEILRFTGHVREELGYR